MSDVVVRPKWWIRWLFKFAHLIGLELVVQHDTPSIVWLVTVIRFRKK